MAFEMTFRLGGIELMAFEMAASGLLQHCWSYVVAELISQFCSPSSNLDSFFAIRLRRIVGREIYMRLQSSQQSDPVLAVRLRRGREKDLKKR